MRAGRHAWGGAMLTLPGVVLAAGRSSRMGRSKALLPLATGEPFVARLVGTLLRGGVTPIVVVTRPGDAALAAVLAPRAADHVRLVANPDPDRGQLSSLQQGLAAVGADVAAALVTLVDVPLVSVATVERLVAAWRASPGVPLVRPAREGRHGHPVIVGRAAIAAVCGASPTAVTRDVLSAFTARGLDVPIEDDAFAFEDVDTPEEYDRLVRRGHDEG
jgi:molybdenum cofactor cytidylyltransferase